MHKFIMISLMALILYNANTFAMSSTQNNIFLAGDSTINNLRASKCVWKYKKENGKLYRRLYDLTEKRWVTDWIFVR